MASVRRNAQSHLKISFFREGEVSDAFAEALAERARNGVKVHFLQDGTRM